MKLQFLQKHWNDGLYCMVCFPLFFFFFFPLKSSFKNMVPTASGFLLWSRTLFASETSLGYGAEKAACYQRPVFKGPSLEILAPLC